MLNLIIDTTDSNEPSETKTKINYDNNINNNRKNNNYFNNNNNNKNKRKLYEDENTLNDRDESEFSNQQKIYNINNKKKENFPKDIYNSHNNIYNEYNDNYYYNSNRNNYSPEKNSKSPINKKYQNNINNNANRSPHNNNNINEDFKASLISNRPKNANITNNIINNQIYNNKINDNNSPNPNNNNEFSNLNYEIKNYKNENLEKNEYYIKYVTLNRQGYEFIHDRNYLKGLLIFQKCQDLSKNYLKDELKEINSLINISICEYYNGNFSESYKEVNKAKMLYNSINSIPLGGNNISPKQKLQLTLKLFINSSLANLSVNKYEESKSDIRFLISTIRKVSDIDKQFSYFSSVIYTLFKVESLINYSIGDNNSSNIIGNSYNDIEISEPIKIINHLMKDFLRFLKERNFGILLNTFNEAAQKYKKLNDFNGYYFSLFYHYLVLYNQKKNNIYDENELEEIKKNISICNNNLIGNELINQIKEKDINILLKEFIDKINCACEIFQLLENFEKELNNKLKEYDKEKNNMNLSEDENNLSYSHLLDKSHLFTNEKINSPIIVKLLLRYSINFLEIQKNNAIQKENINNPNSKSIIDNYDALINEVKIMQQKIKYNEINIENIKLHQLDKEMINSLKQLFDNLIYIYYKCRLYKYFKKFRKAAKKQRNNHNINQILDFLTMHLNEIENGLILIKLNYKTKGYKTHFYNIDINNLTLNILKSQNDNYPNKTFNLKTDVIKVIYGIKSKNLRKKILSKDKDTKELELLRFPWRFISIITKSRSIDLYCDDEQLNNMFYGLKCFFIDKMMPHKINSTNYFVLNKIKLKIAVVLKKKYKRKEENIPNIIQKLSNEKAIQSISFTKLFLIFNKFIKIKNK